VSVEHDCCHDEPRVLDADVHYLSDDGLAALLRRVADHVEQVPRDHETRAVSHVLINYAEETGWSALLVVE
jgi:hypothetical protein